MISVPLRLLLVLGALMSISLVGRNIKKGKMLVEDAVFWMVVACALLVIAIFPDIAIMPAAALGFISPANFVFLVIIGLLLWRTFVDSSEISRLKSKVAELAQEIALDRTPSDEDDPR